jgi:large subunit ribosomal protein L13
MFQQKSYQAKQSGPHFFETEGPNAPKWFYVDAEDQVVGRLATVLARVLTGKHKPTYTRHADTGDFVVVLNAEKVVFTRTKWDKKLYRRHTDYVGGLKTCTAREMLDRNPEEILRQAVWGMTNKSSLARHQMKKLKIFVGKDHPHQAQNPQPMPAGAVRRTVLTQTNSTELVKEKTQSPESICGPAKAIRV